MDRPVIVVSSQIQHRPRLYKCVLAEELGHHFTGAVGTLHCYGDYSRYIQRNKLEQRALFFQVTQGMVQFRLYLSASTGEALWDKNCLTA
jgi:hypothetical protein